MSDVPCALIALRDPITTGRLKMILKQRGWRSESTSSSEDAISLYRTLQPRIVFLGIDLPPNDGHDTALQIRAEDNQGRIVIIAPRNRIEIANETSISVGALTTLITPLIASDVESSWPKIMGVIPPAPGLATFQPVLPEPAPPLPKPLAEMPSPLTNPISPPILEKPKKKRRWLIRSVFLLAIIGGIVAGLQYAGYLPI